MGQTAEVKPVDAEQYLEGERFAEVRHEYVNGRVYAMVGASARHNVIALNLAMALRERLRGGPCQVFMSDVKAHVRTASDECFFYPDLMVACDPADDHDYYRDRPVLIVEVLSDSTERTDRADKFHAYRALDSLEEYVLVAQDVPRVEVYRRGTAWDLELHGEGDALRLDSVDLDLPVEAVYESVAFEGQFVEGRAASRR